MYIYTPLHFSDSCHPTVRYLHWPRGVLLFRYGCHDDATVPPYMALLASSGGELSLQTLSLPYKVKH